MLPELQNVIDTLQGFTFYSNFATCKERVCFAQLIKKPKVRIPSHSHWEHYPFEGGHLGPWDRGGGGGWRLEGQMGSVLN